MNDQACPRLGNRTRLSSASFLRTGCAPSLESPQWNAQGAWPRLAGAFHASFGKAGQRKEKRPESERYPSAVLQLQVRGRIVFPARPLAP